MQKKNKKRAKNAEPIWDRTRRLKIFRAPPAPTFYPVARIDPGVNYFVLMLEQLKAVPRFSCEGHPAGFYVLFSAPQKTAEKIRQCGFFCVELEGRNKWSIRLPAYRRADITERERRYILRQAAAAWEKMLGPLDVTNIYTGAPINKQTNAV